MEQQKNNSFSSAVSSSALATVAVAPGDGIGPEIMDATLQILKAAEVPLNWEPISIGEKEYLNGFSSGIPPVAWEHIRQHKIVLKGPITTPQGGGYKSLNVSMRKTLGLFANVRPCSAYHPYVHTLHPNMDVVIVRENEEDLYAGIEHQQTDEVVQCLKLITRPGCERIIRYAFEYTRANGRKKITCFSKDNIMKQTDGLFHKVFDEIAKEYPLIETEHMIVDIGAARLADTPERFDVIVMPNLYGDILSDVAAQIAGSVGLAGSANIGTNAAIFEAIHGSAPDIAGRQIANPSGLIQASLMMLEHLGLHEYADRIQAAWLKTLEDGYHTADIYREGFSKQKVSTDGFAQAVIERLKAGNQAPEDGSKKRTRSSSPIQIPIYKRPSADQLPVRKLYGVDVFVYRPDISSDELAEKLIATIAPLKEASLKMISNRGVKVWPEGFPETFCTDHWRCRFVKIDNTLDIAELLKRMHEQGIEVIKTENLYTFNGAAGYSMGQGE